MKKFFAAIFVLIGLGNTAANAQAVITNESMIREKRVVTVSFDVDTEVGGVSGKKKEVIMPYIYDEADTLWLEPMSIYGKGRYMREKQENRLNGIKDWTLGERDMLKGGVYNYVDTITVEPWMTSANLGFRRYILGCGTCEDIPSEECVMQDEPLFIVPEYVLENASKKWDFGQDLLEIIFKVSKIEIDSTVFNNEVTFGKILAAVDRIHSNPNYKIEKIQVSGYASPEGRPGFNTWLGENRALALIDYIIEHRPDYGITRETFEIVNGEENWGGLRKVLMESTMDKKDEVIAIIDDNDLQEEAKKQAIKEMDGGSTWKNMLDQIYPHLRSARYLAVYYDSTDDNAVEVINRSNDLLRDRKFNEAYELVMTVSNDMRAFNTIGVSLMGQGRFAEAISWFEKAVENNSLSAQKNIDAIKAEYGF